MTCGSPATGLGRLTYCLPSENCAADALKASTKPISAKNIFFIGENSPDLSLKLRGQLQRGFPQHLFLLDKLQNLPAPKILIGHPGKRARKGGPCQRRTTQAR